MSIFSSLVLCNLTKYMDFQNNHSFCTAWSREGFEEHHASPFYVLSSLICVWGSLECVASTFDIVLHQPLCWKQWMIFWKRAIFVCEVFVFQSYKGIPRNCIRIYPHKLEAINKHVSSFLFNHPPLHMIRYAWPPRLSGHEDFCWTRDPGKRGYVYRCLSWVHSFDTETCFGSWIWSWRCQDVPTTISRHFQNMNRTILSLASVIRFKYQFCTDLKTILSELSNWRVNISSISMLPFPESVRNMTHVGCTMIAGGGPRAVHLQVPAEELTPESFAGEPRNLWQIVSLLMVRLCLGIGILV